jgi:hypothetical protein
MRLRHDLSSLDGRDRLLLMRLATAPVEYHQRAVDAGDYEAAAKLLCRRGGPLADRRDKWRGPDAASLIG